jgi:hypothetical protein
MMYAEHVLRVRVDWSNLAALSERKFGGLGIAYTKCTVPDIPYIPVPEWFRKNPKIVDEPGGPILEGREPKRIRHVGPTDNDMETVMGEADTNMDDMNDQENRARVEVNNLINEVDTEVNLGKFGGITMESKIEELRKQHTEEIREYKAKIFDLENQVARLTIREAGNSSSAPIATSNSNFQCLQAERDIALEEAKIAKSQTLEVCMRNEVMRGKMEALQKEVVDMQQQLQVVNEVVVDHKAKISGLEDQNVKLKKLLLDAIVERKNMRTDTLFAMAKTCQFETEFKNIQREWNRNQRMRNMMLTS